MVPCDGPHRKHEEDAWSKNPHIFILFSTENLDVRDVSILISFFLYGITTLKRISVKWTVNI